MYVITFYSFKGGVGRTMALVNVAAELVRRGRKVLVVDFDLEAPGLETYRHLVPPKPHPGIVEYVAEFRRTFAVPNLLDYVYETKPIGKKGGRMWVMPAGRRDKAYRTALAQLDWQRLYKEEDGFLLFEDTKKAWEVDLQPDYVLIDSRTGDTDVLGICTRQLPDSVVLMFTPNEQNLVGLENVCRDIRREELDGLKKKIRLHFVAANVPDLDDERRILFRQLKRFRERLSFSDGRESPRWPFKNLSGLIRRYENLNLLDQSIFTLERPHTRLARSYRRLIRTLLKDNVADRDGAMSFLKDYPERLETRVEGKDRENPVVRLEYTIRRDGQVYVPDGKGGEIPSVPQSEDKKHLQEIARRFDGDPGILSGVAKSFLLEEDYRSAAHIFDCVLRLEPNNARAFFERAMCKTNLLDVDGAADDLLACLRVSGPVSAASREGAAREIVLARQPTRTTGVPPTGQWTRSFFEQMSLQQACLTKLCLLPPSNLARLAEMIENKEIQGLELSIVVSYLCRREEGVLVAAGMLRNHLAALNESRKFSGFQLAQARCWQEIIDLHEARRLEEEGTRAMFLVVLARWGEDGVLPLELCNRAADAMEREGEVESFHWVWGWQGFGLLLWATGQETEAIKCIEKAEHEASAQTDDEPLSIWRLRYVGIGEYLEDCQLWRRMFQGEPLRPAFLGPARSPMPV